MGGKGGRWRAVEEAGKDRSMILEYHHNHLIMMMILIMIMLTTIMMIMMAETMMMIIIMTVMMMQVHCEIWGTRCWIIFRQTTIFAYDWTTPLSAKAAASSRASPCLWEPAMTDLVIGFLSACVISCTLKITIFMVFFEYEWFSKVFFSVYIFSCSCNFHAKQFPI